MKHAGDAALDGIDGLLGELRAIAGLVERKRGIFYRRSAAFLHFHEDAAGMFADLHDGPKWTRLPVSTESQQRFLLARVRAACDD